MYIDQHFEDYLNDVKNTILEQQSTFINQNGQSPIMRFLIGKLWKFYGLNSKKMEKVPPAMMDRIKKSLDVCALLITERGILFMNEGEGEKITYQIKEEGSENIQLEFIVLDGEKRFDVQVGSNQG